MLKRKTQNARKSTQNSGKEDRRKYNKGRVENLKPFPPGVSGNPGGRPKLLGESYREWLAQVNENDAEGRTNAQLGAVAVGVEMLKGDISAAREIRSATEGEKVRSWEDDLADLVREGKLTLDDVTAEFGNEISARIAVRAGILRGKDGSA